MKTNQNHPITQKSRYNEDFGKLHSKVYLDRELLQTSHGTYVKNYFKKHFKDSFTAIELSGDSESILIELTKKFMKLEDNYVQIGYERSGAFEIAQQDICKIISIKSENILLMTAM